MKIEDCPYCQKAIYLPEDNHELVKLGSAYFLSLNTEQDQCQQLQAKDRRERRHWIDEITVAAIVIGFAIVELGGF